jgi:hypothetical protein
MRDFKGMKRQRGRNNRGGGNTGGKPQQHNANRAFDSNGPDGVKVRGAAQGVYEKYQQLARDATSSGDRVLAENYLQHAEHYFRVLRAIQPNRAVSDIIGKDAYSAYEIDFEAEPDETAYAAEPEPAPEAESEGQREDRQNRDRFENRPRDDRPRDDRPRDDRPRDDRPREDRQQGGQGQGGQNRDRFEGQGQGQGRRDRWRDERPRADQPRGDQPRDERPRDDRPRDDRPREDRPRDDRPREDRFRDERPVAAEAPREVVAAEPVAEARRERPSRRERAPRDPLAVIEPQATPLVSEAASAGSPLLRGQDGDVSHLPAFLGRPTEAPAAADGEEVKKPRRRRAPRSFEGGDGTPPSDAE